jgi:hypothetical protein
VKIDASILETKSFNLPDSRDFVYVVADTWLRIGDARYILGSEFDTGNLIEFLRYFEKRLYALPLLDEISTVVERCGWAVWVRGYWERLNDDTITAEDEALYDLLEPISVMAYDGYIGVYKYNDVAMIEVATRPETSIPVFVCSSFEPAKLIEDLKQIRISVKSTVSTAMSHTNPP